MSEEQTELPSNTQHHVQESADKIKVKTTLKRGTDTRDEDKINVRVKGDEPAQVVAKLDTLLSLLEGTVQNARDMQPEQEGDT